MTSYLDEPSFPLIRMTYNFKDMTSQAVGQSSSSKFFDTIQPFWIGGSSGMMATCIIQPIDMIKVVIQIKSEQGQKATFFSAMKDIMSKKGIMGFYRG